MPEHPEIEIVRKSLFKMLNRAKIINMEYLCIPSYERERIGGKKKVNAIKDGLLILSEIVKYFFKGKT